jgi:putative transcriptional regulator
MKKAVFELLLKNIKEAKLFSKLANSPPGARLRIPKAIDSTAIRAKAGLTLIEFAKQIGVSVATLRNWEQGRRVPDGPAQV